MHGGLGLGVLAHQAAAAAYVSNFLPAIHGSTPILPETSTLSHNDLHGGFKATESISGAISKGSVCPFGSWIDGVVVLRASVDALVYCMWVADQIRPD